MKDILLSFIPTQWLRKSEVWVCICKVRHFSSAAECWNPVTWAFKRFWGQSRNKYINSRANSCPLSLRFLFLRSLVWVFAGQSLIWFWRQIKLMSYPGFYLSCKKQPIGGVAPWASHAGIRVLCDRTRGRIFSERGKEVSRVTVSRPVRRRTTS